MTIHHWIMFLILSLSCSTIEAQVYLQLEKRGSFKVTRYAEGDEVCFKLKGKYQDFRTEYIERIIPEEHIIVFTNGMVHVDNIAAIKSFKRSKWSNPLGISLINFGLGWGVFSLGAVFAGTPLTWTTAVVVGTAVTIGWLVRKVFRYKIYKIGTRRRLRILDLNVIPIQTP